MAQTYRSPVLRAKIATGLLFVNVVVLLAWAWTSYQLRGAWLLEEPAFNELVESYERMHILYLMAYFPSGIAFLFWFRRVCENVEALGGEMTTEPKWAVLAWFVPVLAWFRPYQMTQEVWKQSAPDGHGAHGGTFIQIWWGFWLINLFGERFLVAGEAATEAEFQSFYTGAILVRVASVVAAALAMLVIQRITTRQQARAPVTGAPRARVVSS